MVVNSNMPHPKCLGSHKNPGTEPKTCEKGPKLGFEYLPTSKTSHCVRTACMAFPKSKTTFQILTESTSTVALTRVLFARILRRCRPYLARDPRASLSLSHHVPSICRLRESRNCPQLGLYGSPRESAGEAGGLSVDEQRVISLLSDFKEGGTCLALPYFSHGLFCYLIPGIRTPPHCVMPTPTWGEPLA